MARVYTVPSSDMTSLIYNVIYNLTSQFICQRKIISRVHIQGSAQDVLPQCCSNHTANDSALICVLLSVLCCWQAYGNIYLTYNSYRNGMCLLNILLENRNQSLFMIVWAKSLCTVTRCCVIFYLTITRNKDSGNINMQKQQHHVEARIQRNP